MYLPRKFKIGVAWPGDNCVDVFSNDVALVPTLGEPGDVADGDGPAVTGYMVYIGGGMGMAWAREDDTYPRLAIAARMGHPGPRDRHRRGRRHHPARLRQP